MLECEIDLVTIMALNDSLREMFAMIELEMRRLRHDRTEITPVPFSLSFGWQSMEQS